MGETPAAEIEGSAWDIRSPDEPATLPILPPPNHPAVTNWILLPKAAPRVVVEDPTDPPWSAFVLLCFFFRDILIRVGTGFFVGPNEIVTARHNLEPANYDRAGAWLAYDAVRNPNALQLTVRSRAVHPQLDMAVLYTEEATPFYFAISRQEPSEGALAGYSMPYTDGRASLTQAAGPVVYGLHAALGYRISTRPGDSGAPIFHLSAGAPEVVGMHTEAPVANEPLNAGIHFSPPVRDEIDKLIAAAHSFAQEGMRT